MTRLLALALTPWSPVFIGAALFVSGLTIGVLVARPY
jgi:hypothetical protein